MAVVRDLEEITLERDSQHTEVNATYAIIHANDGVYLQIDTYGSRERQEIGKKSQSIRLSPEALEKICSIMRSIGYCK